MTNVKARVILDSSLNCIINSAQTMSKSYRMWPLLDAFPIYADSLKGCMMKSVDGEEFIDLMGGLGTNFIDQKVAIKGIKKQLKKGLNFSLSSALETELAQLWLKLFPGQNYVKFCKNGSDAVSGAIRAARQYTQKDKILMVNGGYHGFASDFAVVSERNGGIPNILAQYVEKINFNDITALEEKLSTGSFACFIVEPVSLAEPLPEYFKCVRELCDKFGVVLIFDELVTGFRFSSGSYPQTKYGVSGDIITVGKACGSGVPLAGILFRDHLKGAFEDMFFSATGFGECLSLAAGIEVAQYILNHKDTIYPYVWKMGNKFKDNFNSKCIELKLNASTMGLAPRINLKFNTDESVGARDLYHIEMIKRGVFAGIQIYITPCHQPKHIKKILQASNESLEIVSDAVKNNKLDEYLQGKRSMVIFKRQ